MAKRNKPAEEPAKPAATATVTDAAPAETPENVEQSPEPEAGDEEDPDPPTESEDAPKSTPETEASAPKLITPVIAAAFFGKPS